MDNVEKAPLSLAQRIWGALYFAFGAYLLVCAANMGDARTLALLPGLAFIGLACVVVSSTSSATRGLAITLGIGVLLVIALLIAALSKAIYSR